MKTFEEAFLAALSTKPSTLQDELTRCNLEEQGREVLQSQLAADWAISTTQMYWKKMGDEVGPDDFRDGVLAGMVAGIRIGIEMEKE